MFTETSRKLLAAVAFVAVAAVPVTLSAQKSYVYEFLRNDASARASAMGGAFTSVGGDPAGMFYNPALITTVDSTQVSFTLFKHLLDINSGSATFVTDLDGIGPIGVGVNFTSFGSFESSDRNANVTGEFGASDILLTAGWGSQLGEGFSVGLSGSSIFSTIETVGSVAFAVNGGVYFADTTRRVHAGVSILHLGGQVSSYGTVSEPLPLDLRLGASHQLRGLPLLLSAEFSNLLDPKEEFVDRFSAFAIGGEFTLSRVFQLRLGYNNRIRQDLPFGTSKGLSGFSGGLGVTVSDYRFDYAFNSYDRLGGTHRITINARF